MGVRKLGDERRLRNRRRAVTSIQPDIVPVWC